MAARSLRRRHTSCVNRPPTPLALNHAAVLEVLRTQGPTTRPELERTTGLGRKIISERVQELIDLGLASEGAFAQSTGGRMPREVGFNAGRGLIGVSELNAHHMTVGLTDLAGRALVLREIPGDVAAGPAAACAAIEAAVLLLLAEVGRTTDDLWGVGVGVTAPVDPADGRIFPGHLFDLTTMAGWDGYPVRDDLVARLRRPVWVDNEVNLMALGELRAGMGRGYQHLVFVKLGPSVGGGLVMGGVLQRGVAAAGEIGHLAVPHDEPRLCWCGGRGCLFTFVEESVLLAEAGGVVVELDSPPALGIGGGDKLGSLVRSAAAGGLAEEILTRAGARIGATLVNVITLLNPQLLVVGGSLVTGGDVVVDAIRREINEKAIPLASEQLTVEVSPLSDQAGLIGAAFMVADALFTPEALATWLADRTPKNYAGVPRWR
jgi:predicted NBD/HSP70 family sugar kinase